MIAGLRLGRCPRFARWGHPTSAAHSSEPGPGAKTVGRRRNCTAPEERGASPPKLFSDGRGPKKVFPFAYHV